MVFVSFLSFVNYENTTEPQGLHGICNGSIDMNYSENKTHNSEGARTFLYSNNVSYLGNKADLMLWICPLYYIFNLSDCVYHTNDPGSLYKIVYTTLFISNESYAPYYSHLVISVTNFSIAFNKTMFYNVSTNKGDVFGNYIELNPYWGFEGNWNVYHYSLGENPLPFRGPPVISMAKVIIPGNYTFYENITFTITVSLGILHFTSQEYSIHKSWWELWGYNDQKN